MSLAASRVRAERTDYRRAWLGRIGRSLAPGAPRARLRAAPAPAGRRSPPRRARAATSRGRRVPGAARARSPRCRGRSRRSRWRTGPPDVAAGDERAGRLRSRAAVERVVAGAVRSHDARCRSAARVRAVRAAGAAAVRALRGDRRLERPVDVVAEARVLRDVLRHVLERRAVALHGIDAVDPAVVPVVDERLPARILRGGRGREENRPAAAASTSIIVRRVRLTRVGVGVGSGFVRTSGLSLRKCLPIARQQLLAVSSIGNDGAIAA